MSVTVSLHRLEVTSAQPETQNGGTLTAGGTLLSKPSLWHHLANAETGEVSSGVFCMNMKDQCNGS